MLITDDITGERYRLDVSVPDAPRPSRGYPVLYVLDGNARFALLREARDTLTRKGPDDTGLPLVIVGIGYPGGERFNRERRRRDFASGLGHWGSKEEADSMSPVGSVTGLAPVAGEEPDFLRFLTVQLMPWAERRLGTDSQRQALLGHSLGGLFVLHVQQRCSDCFDSLFAISPSLWWGNGILASRLEQRISEDRWCRASSGRSLLIGVGEHEQTARSGDSAERASLRRTRAMVDRARDYQVRLSQACTGLSSQFVLFPGEDHGSVMWPAARRVIEQLSHRYHQVAHPVSQHRIPQT